MSAPHRILLATLGALFTLAACGKEEATPATESPAPAAKTEAPAPEAAAPAAPAPAVSPADAAMDKGRIAYGGVCVGCHGKQGEGQGVFPKVAGKPAQELAAKLRDYREGKQMGPQTAIMAPNAKNLSDEDIDALANYMATLQGK